MDAARELVDLEDLTHVAVLPAGGLRAGVFEFKAVLADAAGTAQVRDELLGAHGSRAARRWPSSPGPDRPALRRAAQALRMHR